MPAILDQKVNPLMESQLFNYILIMVNLFCNSTGIFSEFILFFCELTYSLCILQDEKKMQTHGAISVFCLCKLFIGRICQILTCLTQSKQTNGGRHLFSFLSPKVQHYFIQNCTFQNTGLFVGAVSLRFME